MTNQKSEVTIRDVAAFIFEKSQNPPPVNISQMKLYKLLWFCQGWHFGVLKKPLFNEDFEAWQFGPVSRDLWNIFKGKIDLDESDFKKLDGNPDKLKGDTREVVKAVFESFRNTTAADLMKLTHQDGPWRKYHEPGTGGVIPQEDIKGYFEGLAQKEGIA